VVQLKSVNCDGTTKIVMSAQEFMQRLITLVPLTARAGIVSAPCWRANTPPNFSRFALSRDQSWPTALVQHVAAKQTDGNPPII
jgi:hypothetical protein